MPRRVHRAENADYQWLGADVVQIFLDIKPNGLFGMTLLNDQAVFIADNRKKLKEH